MSSSSERPRSVRVIRGSSQTVALSPVPPAPPAASVAPRATGKEARPSVEELIESARRDAFEEGRRAGEAAARKAAECVRATAVRSTARQLADAARRVAELRAEVVEEVVGDLAGLVTDLAEILVGRELIVGQTAAREAIERALELAPRGPDLVVRVHPECGLDDEDIAEIAIGTEVAVVRDPEIDVHGCRITVGGCHIDAQIPSALARVRSAIDELLPSLAAASGGNLRVRPDAPPAVGASGEADAAGEEEGGPVPHTAAADPALAVADRALAVAMDPALEEVR